MAPLTDQLNSATLVERKSLSAVVHRACSECGAPAVYHSSLSIKESWPGCWVPPGHPKENQVSEDSCPNCGSPRHKFLTEDKGEIWSQEAHIQLPFLVLVALKVYSFFSWPARVLFPIRRV